MKITIKKNDSSEDGDYVMLHKTVMCDERRRYTENDYVKAHVFSAN